MLKPRNCENCLHFHGRYVGLCPKAGHWVGPYNNCISWEPNEAKSILEELRKELAEEKKGKRKKGRKS